ncbi:VOC family protein [Aeromicrobium sp. NPDC092404]|uniref:VOC family protein n=1 Tax=Aeromicrobium sp. NPDC092404 TaxID=3154976 RepID=UPI00343DFCB9
MASIAQVNYLVRDLDEALSYFADRLGFAVLEDSAGSGRRRVVVAPPGGSGAALVLKLAETDESQAMVGRQGGGVVLFFLETDDFDRDHARMREAGVAFREEPRHEAYGSVAVFEDLYGNAWDLIQPA